MGALHSAGAALVGHTGLQSLPGYISTSKTALQSPFIAPEAMPMLINTKAASKTGWPHPYFWELFGLT